MRPGSSAASEAQRQLALAEAHEIAARSARVTARNYEIAATTEAQTARILAPLSATGFHLFPDRGWPGSRNAQVDLLVVGPAGVFIVDTKAWAEVQIVNERIFRGQADVTDELAGLADLAYNTAAELAQLGLAPGEVHAVVALAGKRGIREPVGPVTVLGDGDVLRYISGFGARLTPAQVDAVTQAVLQYFPLKGASAPVNATVPEPVLAAPSTEIDVDTLISPSEVEFALQESLLAAPIEEWMTFLHPTQAKLARRSFNGPARIRGAAGTGKTVVGLHRAAYLAKFQPGRVLVTTYVRTLPQVLESLLARMAPDVSERVEFCGIHQFARRILSERGIAVRLDPQKADLIWRQTWSAHAKNAELSAHNLDSRYWKEEVFKVIKARGITSFDQYADLERTGRRYPLQAGQRRAVWDLYTDYSKRLRSAEIHDFDDLILLAAAEMQKDPLPGYGAVIVDEAQDLSAAAIRMLHALVGDAPDGFTLIGDGQQAIYPGGYTLKEVGISVAGRGVVLDLNYRNTKEVVEFAQNVVAGDEVSDIEGDTAPSYPQIAEIAERIPRSGPTPQIEHFASARDQLRALISRVRSAAQQPDAGFSDLAVLAITRAGVRRAHRTLQEASIPVRELEKYTGQDEAKVKVGTVKRAKGLEFKRVFIIDFPRHLLEPEMLNPRTTDPGLSESEILQRRELYVAMTRARDELWLGVV